MARLKTLKSRTQGANFDVYEDSDRIRDVRVDGITNLFVGAADAKLFFYAVRNIEQPDSESGIEPIEVRDVTLRMSIPTRALLEACLNILTSVKTNQEGLVKAHRDEEKKIVDVLEKIQQLVDKKHQH